MLVSLRLNKLDLTPWISFSFDAVNRKTRVARKFDATSTAVGIAQRRISARVRQGLATAVDLQRLLPANHMTVCWSPPEWFGRGDALHLGGMAQVHDEWLWRFRRRMGI